MKPRTTRHASALLAGVLALATGLGSAQPASQPPVRESVVLLRCGKLLAVPGKEPQQNVTLVVRNGKVDRVVPGFTEQGPRDANVIAQEIDLRDKFVLPGLIDCHVHLTMEFTADVRLRAVSETDADVALRGAAFAKKTLEAGFTTVRDLGAFSGIGIAIRDAVNRGDIPGPRILAAGKAISVTGGHGARDNGYRPDVWGGPGEGDGIADGEAECMKAVRYQIKMGADCIKLMATGGVLSASNAGLAQHFFDEELVAIIKTAHSMGRKVAAHAHGTDGINAALRAGVDSVEHGTFLDDESVRLLKEKGAYLVPTMLAAATVAKNAEIPGYYLPMVAAKARIVGPRIKEAVAKAHAAGVRIAFGTDTGVSPHGENAKEFGLLVDAGLTPSEAIHAATVAAAELCGISDRVGTLDSGKSADVVAVDGDPLKDVTVLERVGFVMKEGRVYFQNWRQAARKAE